MLRNVAYELFGGPTIQFHNTPDVVMLSAPCCSALPEDVPLARQAYRDYGKGSDRAGLNFGDCFAYALSVKTGEPLLYKGDDFVHTDVKFATVAAATED